MPFLDPTDGFMRKEGLLYSFCDKWYLALEFIETDNV